MKKSVIAGLVAVLVLGSIGMPAATAKKRKKKPKPVPITFEESGAMRVAGPTSAALFGVTDGEFIVNECASVPATQGHDAYIVEIPPEFAMGDGTLEVIGTDATGAHDMDVYFYDAACGLLEPYLTDGADPSGPINGGAKWAVVSLFQGANATFELTGTAMSTP